MAEIAIRRTAPEEYRAASATVSMALLNAPMNDEDWERSAPSWPDCDSFSAWDGDRCVGHAGAFRFETLVPGGARLPTGGVTRVGVLPTHRRRGVAGGLMRQLLLEAAASGQPLASLRASEAVIYHRFGFGVAGDACDMSLDSRAARPIAGAAPGTMRLLRPDEILDVLPPLYERAATRPGAITRPAWMWKRYYRTALEAGGDAEFVAVHTAPDGIDDGYVHYSVKWKEVENEPGYGVGGVIELYGVDTGIELALWAYLCDLDLVRKWTSDERPVDDAVRLAVADRRAYSVKLVWDEQWLRLLDVDAALAARTYGEAGGSVTIAVTDTLLDANNGVWRVDAKGAERIDVDPSEADLLGGVAEVAVPYLGGYRWSQLADVGRIQVRRPEATAIADTLFLTARAPQCGSFF